MQPNTQNNTALSIIFHLVGNVPAWYAVLAKPPLHHDADKSTACFQFYQHADSARMCRSSIWTCGLAVGNRDQPRSLPGGSIAGKVMDRLSLLAGVCGDSDLHRLRHNGSCETSEDGQGAPPLSDGLPCERRRLRRMLLPCVLVCPEPPLRWCHGCDG